MTMGIFLTAIGLFLALVYLMKHVYVFQIKEYRFDTIRARIEDTGIGAFLYGWDIRTPSVKHPRNIGILILGTVIITLISQILPQTVLSALLLIALAPVLAFLVAACGVLITSIPVSIYRRHTISKARQLMAYIHPTIIAITGSYGKSTTKDYLFEMLSLHHKTAKTDRNQNTDIGVALSALRNLSEKTEYFVIEMGAYRSGEISAITRFAPPKIAVITAIGSQHISLFGGKEKLFLAKSEVAQQLPKDGRLFIASDIEPLLKLRLRKIAPCPVEEYEAVAHDPHQTAVHAASVVARHLGMTDEEVRTLTQRLEKPAHLLPFKHPIGYEYLDCSYNSNVEGFIAHLHMLRSLRKKKKFILASGVIELGKEKKKMYTRILAELPAHTTLFTSDRTFRLVANKTQLRSIIYEPDHYRLFARIGSKLDRDTAILIEGKFRQDFVDRIIS